MTRGMTSAYTAGLSESDLRPCILFEAEFPSGSLRLWTGLGDVVWNSETWIGAGNLIGITDISETSDVVASSVTVSLSGVPVDLVASAITDAQQGLPGKVWVGLLDENGAIIADPVMGFAGRLDVPNIEDGAETCVISISYESRLVDLNTPREWRYTQESQQLLSPGDLGFEYVTSLQDRQLSWGQ